MTADQIREFVKSGDASLSAICTVHGYWIIEAFIKSTGRYHQLRGIRGAPRQFRTLDALARAARSMGAESVQVQAAEPD